VRLVFLFTFAFMRSFQELIAAGWDISIFRQKKRDGGDFITLLQWRAKKFSELKEYTNESKGFLDVNTCIEDISNNLPE